MYSFNSRVRYSELNHQREILSASSIINYFQDCSTFQSEELNRGLSYLNSENKMWLLNSWQVEIHKSLRLGDYITIGTWPYDFKGFYGYRNFIILDERKEMAAVANSIWVYLDLVSGRPAKIPENFGETSGYGIEPPYPMEYSNRKIELSGEFTPLPSFTVTKSNIDSYSHVNNGQYIKMAEEYLSDNFMIKTMRAEYKMQAKLGDVITPMVALNNNTYTVILAAQSMKPYSIIEFSGLFEERNNND